MIEEKGGWKLVGVSIDLKNNFFVFVLNILKFLNFRNRKFIFLWKI